MFKSNPGEFIWLVFQLVVLASIGFAIGACIINALRTRSAKADQTAAIRRDMLRTQRLARTYPRVA